MTYEFTYTKEFDVDSSLIDSVLYSENDEKVALDVDGTVYVYSNVTPSDVGSLVSGDHNGSVGAYYNRVFKEAFGPSEKAGHWSEVSYLNEPVKKDANVGVTTPKGLVSAGEVTVNTGVFDHGVSGSPIATDTPTREHSLSLAPAVKPVLVSEADYVTTVHFRLDGYDKVYTHEANTLDVADALEQVNVMVSAFGAKGKVVKVVVDFV